jgi:Protein of unknown function (DUF1569)
MNSFYEPARVDEVTQRMERLRPDTQPLWGKMNPAQALAHCSTAMEMAVGKIHPPRMFIGRILGPLVKRKVLAGPMSRNAPTAKILVVADQRDLAAERERLRSLVAQFAAAGPQGCTTHPHVFFGNLTPDEWAALMYKHVDHHLQQFGV